MDLILYNPKSKNSRANVQTHRLIKKYKKEKKPFRLKSIIKVDDIASYLDDRKHYDNIILLGGDGTINQLVNNLQDYQMTQEIYLKKNGSGNDFLRSLKNNDTNPQVIMQNTLDGADTHYFINGTGIGLDGLVIDYVDKAKNKGKLSYFISSFKAMMNFVPEPLDVEIDGEHHHFEKAYSLIINNGRFVGGGMEMTKHANLTDDSLDLLVIHSIRKAFLLVIFSTVYLGLHTKFKKYVFYRKCKHVKGTFTTPQISQSDGEKHLDVTSVEVQSANKTIHFKAY
jgi:diacylglycerol kinase family enzyme